MIFGVSMTSYFPVFMSMKDALENETEKEDEGGWRSAEYIQQIVKCYVIALKLMNMHDNKKIDVFVFILTGAKGV